MLSVSLLCPSLVVSHFVFVFLFLVLLWLVPCKAPKILDRFHDGANFQPNYPREAVPCLVYATGVIASSGAWRSRKRLPNRSKISGPFLAMRIPFLSSLFITVFLRFSLFCFAVVRHLCT